MPTLRLVLLLFVVLLLVLSPAAIFAQDAALTCDEALDAARAAYDNDDKDTAWSLAAQAEVLCLHEPLQFSQAQGLRSRSEGSAIDWATAAEPGGVALDDDHSAFLACKGEGSPTVIFEPWGGGTWLDWKNIQPAVSTVTRACAYTRATPGSDEVRTAQDQVDDLMTLLEIAEIEPPYIFVGIESAGFTVPLLAGQHPDLVDGMVLIEVYLPEFWGLFAENPDLMDPVFAFTFQKILEDPLYDSPHLDILASSEQAVVFDDFGNIPLAVLASNRRVYTEEGLTVYMALLEDFVSRSTNSRLTIAESPLGAPEIILVQPIIEEIFWVLDEARAAED